MKGSERLKAITKDQKGSTSVIIICVTMIIILAAALLTDIGYASVQRFKLRNNAERIAKDGAEILVNSRDKALGHMKSSAVKKEYNLNALDIRISDNNREITVSMGKPFKYIFLSHLGFESKQIKTSVTVKLACVDEYKGVRPFAVEKQNINFGKSIILSDKPASRPEIMKFFPINTGIGGFKANIIYGSGKLLKTGEKVEVFNNYSISHIKEGLNRIVKKCDRQPVCTFDNYESDCSRIVVLPVVDKNKAENSTAFVISGFAAFFIESFDTYDSYVNIKGRFIRYTVKSDTNDGAEDFGLFGLRMIN